MTKDDMNDAITNTLMTKKPKTSIIPAEDLLSTGSTLLDLGLSGRLAGGLFKGGYFPFIGDSGSGKTFLFHTCLAEAAINSNFDNYRFICDMPEDGSYMDHEAFFGKRCADRIEAPAYNGALPSYSRTVEQFYDRVDAAFKTGPCIYILDSENALSCDADLSLVKEQAKAREKGKDIPQSYHMMKPKIHSQRFAETIGLMQESRSILIMVCQTRDKVGATMYEKKVTRSGGKAIKFFAQAELWMSVGSVLKKDVKGIPMKIGAISRIHIEKNRLSGKDRTIEIPIYYSAGMDDIGSCVEFLVKWKHWPTVQGKGVDASRDLDVKGPKEKIIKWIETNNAELELKGAVLECWNTIEEECRVERKNKYDFQE